MAKDEAGSEEQEKGKEEEVSANEDLMREHGVLDRVLLVYEEALRRLDAREELPAVTLVGGADLVRRFIEDYHEKLEEGHLFPRFEKARKLPELVATLRAQHQAGRRLTEAIQRLSAAATLKDDASRRQLFGDDGFERILAEVVRLEKAVGIDDLNRFTPA